MRVTIDFDDIELDTTQAEIIQEWLNKLIKDKSTDNLSPLRYADRIEFSRWCYICYSNTDRR